MQLARSVLRSYVVRRVVHSVRRLPFSFDQARSLTVRQGMRGQVLLGCRYSVSAQGGIDGTREGIVVFAQQPLGQGAGKHSPIPDRR